MRNLLNFKGWESTNESDGFGTSAFLLKKEKDQYNYFFNLEEKKDDKGFHMIIGKYSEKEVISGSKNSYCVLGLYRISDDLIDDIAVGKAEIPSSNNERFKADENETSRILECVAKCILDYLEKMLRLAEFMMRSRKHFTLKGKELI